MVARQEEYEHHAPNPNSAGGVGFKKGHKRLGGMVKGQVTKEKRLLRELLLQAAELEGSDGKGKDGILGLLRRLAKEDLKTFALLLGRVMPLQLDVRSDVKVDVTYRSVAEVKKDLEERGISIELISEIMSQPSDEEAA